MNITTAKDYIVCPECNEATHYKTWKVTAGGLKCQACGKTPTKYHLMARASTPNPHYKKRRWGAELDPPYTMYRYSIHEKKKKFWKLPKEERVVGYWAMVGDILYISCISCGGVNQKELAFALEKKICTICSSCQLHYFPLLEGFRAPKGRTVLPS